MKNTNLLTLQGLTTMKLNINMREIVIHTLKEKAVPVEALNRLIWTSFEQWKSKGLYVSLSDDTHFANYVKGRVVYIVEDAATGELLAVHTLKPNKRKGGAWGANLAVAPSAKNEGIATRLLQEEITQLRQRGYRYLQGSTGIPAVWSVRWHLKNGYRIVGYGRNEKENYASYTFRKQFAYDIKHHPTDIFWLPCIAPVTARLTYAITFLITCICKNRSGELNVLGRFAKRLRR